MQADHVIWHPVEGVAACDSNAGFSTLWDALAKTALANASRRAVGHRPILTMTIVDGFEKYTLGEDEWVTYGEYLDKVENLGSGMAKSIPSLSKGDTVQGLSKGTIYSTLGADGALFGFNQSRRKVVVADSKLLKVLATIAPGTLAPTSIKMLQMNPPQQGDAQLLRPTKFVAAPAVLNKILIAIKCKFAATGGLVYGIINEGSKSGMANFDKAGVGTKHCLAKLIFKKAQGLLGGRMECILKGSARLGSEGEPTVAQGYLVESTNPDPDIVEKNNTDIVTIDGIRYFCS
ncbi:MAG: hypothetical protein SGPRY_001759, partial [Prymnesium sp.]